MGSGHLAILRNGPVATKESEVAVISCRSGRAVRGGPGTSRPSTSRRVCQQSGECHSQGDGTPRIVRAGPSSLTVLRIPLRGTRLRRAVDPGVSASPAGLAARARPKARPDRRAANLRSGAPIRRTGRSRAGTRSRYPGPQEVMIVFFVASR
jgi:hypothetical protein